MSLGMILLVVLALLILFGVLQRVLDRMALTDKQALLCVAAIFIGGWLPDLNLGAVTLNWGGAIVPLAVCVYLFFHAGTGMGMPATNALRRERPRIHAIAPPHSP